MIGPRKIRANRANARASTGPRTAAGKARASRNALRHGLSLPVLADPALAAEVRTMARAIAGEGASATLHQLAARIAEAQIDLLRVRRARHELLARSLGSSDDPSPTSAEDYQELVERMTQRMDSNVPMPRGLKKLLAIELEAQKNGVTNLADCAERLQAMDRYERRALSRRKFAIRAFDAACRQAAA